MIRKYCLDKKSMKQEFDRRFLKKGCAVDAGKKY